jgi:hypothetical protein
VGGFNGGEPELAIKMADAAAEMLVIMDRGFPGVALWKYRDRGSSADSCPVERRCSPSRVSARRYLPGEDEPGRAERRASRRCAGTRDRVPRRRWRVSGPSPTRSGTPEVSPGAARRSRDGVSWSARPAGRARCSWRCGRRCRSGREWPRLGAGP